MPPKLQTIGPDIAAQLTEIALNGGSHAKAQQAAFMILAECKKLQKVDVIGASLLKANLFALMGEVDQCDYWLKNASQNGAPPSQIVPQEMLSHLLGGRISQSLALFDQAYDFQRGEPLAYIRKALSMCCFRRAARVAATAKDGAIEPQLVDLAADGSLMLDVLDLPEERVAQLMDEVHGLLIENKLIWLDNLPQIQFLDAEHGGPVIWVGYRLATSPEHAADLNWQVAARLCERGLDSIGILATFLGTELQSATATAGSHAFA